MSITITDGTSITDIDPRRIRTYRDAIRHVQNYPSIQVDELRNAAFDYMKAHFKDFPGGSFEFLGDVAGLYEVFAIEEAQTIGSKKRTRAWIFGRVPGTECKPKLVRTR